VKLKHQASVDSFRGDITNIAEWEKTEAAMNLFNEMRALEVEKSICDKQAEKVSTASREKSTQRSFIQLFTTSVLGLGITHTGAGRRDTSVQSKFRSDLLEHMEPATLTRSQNMFGAQSSVTMSIQLQQGTFSHTSMARILWTQSLGQIKYLSCSRPRMA
jgi:hypothetical protein